MSKLCILYDLLKMDTGDFIKMILHFNSSRLEMERMTMLIFIYLFIYLYCCCYFQLKKENIPTVE